MKVTRNVKAISKLLLILLLLTATIIGAILSYLWVIGYYINLGIRIPEKPTASITNATFTPQNTSYFNVTLLNPSYSPSDATITQIATSTEDGTFYNVTVADPQLPYKLPKAKEKTFRCLWNWANYTGQNVKIIAFVADGSGPTFEAETPFVDLKITDIRFNSTISVTQFNITVQNSLSSATYVNITEVTVERESISAGNLTLSSIPYLLDLGESVSFTCSWNWTDYQDKNVTVAVYTLQGYAAYFTRLTPKPVILNITNVLFNVADMTRFNVTVQNSEDSPTYVNITRITLTIENRTLQEWTAENRTEVDPDLPYTLNPNSSQTFSCLWNWTDQRDKNVTIAVYTLQGFVAYHTQVTPAPVILEIVDVVFAPRDTTSFNVTVKNSEFSIIDANITEITVTVDGISGNITGVVPSLQGGITLIPGANITFTCSWDWAEHSGKNATIGVQTSQGYGVYSSPVSLAALTITEVLFNLLDKNHFIVTVQNPTGLNFTITTINATVEGMASLNITDVTPSLPFMLPDGTDILFMCSSNWIDYQGKDVTITIETLEGYTTSYTRTIPSE